MAPTADDALDRAALDALRITELITGTAAAVAELDEETLDREAAEALAENERLRAEYGSDDEDEEEASSPRDIMQWLQDVIDDQPSRDPRIAEAWAAFEKEDGALSTDRMPDKAAIEAAERALDEEAARAAGVEVDGVLDDDDEDDDAAAAALERKLDRHLARSVENRLDDLAGACRARSKAARARAENAAKARRKASPGPFLTAVEDDDDDGPTRPVTPRTAWVAELRSACDEGRSRIASRRAELRTRPRASRRRRHSASSIGRRRCSSRASACDCACDVRGRMRRRRADVTYAVTDADVCDVRMRTYGADVCDVRDARGVCDVCNGTARRMFKRRMRTYFARIALRT